MRLFCRLTLLSGLLSLSLVICGNLYANDLRITIEQSNEAFIQAMNSGDADRVASFFSEQGAVLPPNGEMAEGGSQIRAFWQTVIAGGLKATLETREVTAFGQYAYELGYYYLRTPAGVLKDRGKYIVIWVNGSGGWKMYRDIFNSSIALPSAPAAAQ